MAHYDPCEVRRARDTRGRGARGKLSAYQCTLTALLKLPSLRRGAAGISSR